MRSAGGGELFSTPVVDEAAHRIGLRAMGWARLGQFNPPIGGVRRDAYRARGWQGVLPRSEAAVVDKSVVPVAKPQVAGP